MGCFTALSYSSSVPKSPKLRTMYSTGKKSKYPILSVLIYVSKVIPKKNSCCVRLKDACSPRNPSQKKPEKSKQDVIAAAFFQRLADMNNLELSKLVACSCWKNLIFLHTYVFRLPFTKLYNNFYILYFVIYI